MQREIVEGAHLRVRIDGKPQVRGPVFRFEIHTEPVFPNDRRALRGAEDLHARIHLELAAGLGRIEVFHGHRPLPLVAGSLRVGVDPIRPEQIGVIQHEGNNRQRLKILANRGRVERARHDAGIHCIVGAHRPPGGWETRRSGLLGKHRAGKHIGLRIHIGRQGSGFEGGGPQRGGGCDPDRAGITNAVDRGTIAAVVGPAAVGRIIDHGVLSGAGDSDGKRGVVKAPAMETGLSGGEVRVSNIVWKRAGCRTRAGTRVCQIAGIGRILDCRISEQLGQDQKIGIRRGAIQAMDGKDIEARPQLAQRSGQVDYLRHHHLLGGSLRDGGGLPGGGRFGIGDGELRLLGGSAIEAITITAIIAPRSGSAVHEREPRVAAGTPVIDQLLGHSAGDGPGKDGARRRQPVHRGPCQYRPRVGGKHIHAAGPSHAARIPGRWRTIARFF